MATPIKAQEASAPAINLKPKTKIVKIQLHYYYRLRKGALAIVIKAIVIFRISCKLMLFLLAIPLTREVRL